MDTPKYILLAALCCLALAFVVLWGRSLIALHRQQGGIMPTPYELLVGLVTDFFDTLGIGSFATTTAFYRARKTIDDRHLPGTLNVGHTIPTFAQAIIYIKEGGVDSTTLIAMIAAAVAGALSGASLVARWDRRRIQHGMGLALCVLSLVMLYRVFVKLEGTTLELSGGLFALGIAGNFVLGALMTIGIGLYGPCVVMVSLLGMNPDAAFPIMMGSCAFLMPFASIPFVRSGNYAPRAALGLTLAGLPAAVVAALVVKSLPLNYLKVLVAVVAAYTGAMLLRAARERQVDPKSAF